MVDINKKSIDKIQNKLKNKLSEHRYIHTIGVAYTASCMAMKYSCDIDKAFLAGLLHDCAKYMNNDEFIKFATQNDIKISDAEKNKPDLLHAKIGAYFAKEKYGIKDKEIISAIRFHTTGKPNMSIFEKIIYIADYIEPGRDKMPRLDVIRKVAFEDLDQCLCMILEDSVEYLKKSGMNIDNTTIETYEFYCNN